jgi:uncharacterized membrane protein YdjX (TVP38/TMEM64 family)
MLNWIQLHKIKLFLSTILAGAVIVFAAVYFTELNLEDIKGWVQFWIDEIQTWPPVLFFLMVALLPLIGFPISPLFIMAGIRFGVDWAIPFCLSALAVNLVLSHWISTKILHNFIQKIANRWNYDLPKVSHKNAAKWVFIVRISGAPLAVQNYLLGLSYVPFWPYLWVSLAVQAPIVIGVIVFGESFFSGNMGKALLGLGLLVIAFFAVSYFRKRYAQPKPGTADTTIG